MAFIASRNRFNEFRDEFLKDTGVKTVDDNLKFRILNLKSRIKRFHQKLIKSEK